MQRSLVEREELRGAWLHDHTASLLGLLKHPSVRLHHLVLGAKCAAVQAEDRIAHQRELQGFARNNRPALGSSLWRVGLWGAWAGKDVVRRQREGMHTYIRHAYIY